MIFRYNNLNCESSRCADIINAINRLHSNTFNYTFNSNDKKNICASVFSILSASHIYTSHDVYLFYFDCKHKKLHFFCTLMIWSVSSSQNVYYITALPLLPQSNPTFYINYFIFSHNNIHFVLPISGVYTLSISINVH